METEKQDLRVAKTQRALAAAMLALLEKQPFSKITVNDLCQEAMVSRSTFYVHFEDKYALLQFCMQELRARFFRDSEGSGPRERFCIVAQHIQANARLVRNLLTAELDTELMEMLRKSFLDDMTRLAARRGSPVPPEIPLDLVAAFYAGGITSMMMLWIRQGFRQTPEALAECQYRLIAGLLPPSEQLP